LCSRYPRISPTRPWLSSENAWNARETHRYLMTRLSLQVFYLWRHLSSTAPPLILWWSNLEILFGPLHRSSPFIGELRCQAIHMEHGPYIAEITQKAVCSVRCLWRNPFKKRSSHEIWLDYLLFYDVFIIWKPVNPHDNKLRIITSMETAIIIPDKFTRKYRRKNNYISYE
jgi:hypothetical protein